MEDEKKPISLDSEMPKPQWFEKLKKKIDVPIPDYFKDGKIIEIHKTKQTYLFLLALLLIFIGLSIIITFVHIALIVKYLFYFIVGLILFIMFVFFLARLLIFGDMQRLRNKIIVSKSDYIRATFFTVQKRIRERVFIPSENGREIEIGNHIYLIDTSCVWIDDDNVPNIFYISGIPNPLNFDFQKYLEKYFDRLEKGDIESNIKENLDVRYSSDTLKLMKNDKLMKEMHRDSREDMNKMMLYFMIAFGIFAVILIIVIITGNKAPVVQVVNSTVSNGGVQ